MIYLVKIIEDDAELAKLLHPSRYIDVTVQIDRQRGLIDDSLHASDSEVVVAVIKSGIDQAFLAEAEDLPTCQGAYEGERSSVFIYLFVKIHN